MTDIRTIKKIGHAVGFDLVETTLLTQSEYAERVSTWVDRGLHADMAWYEKSMDRRIDPRQHLYGSAVTAITVGLLYRPPDIPEEVLNDPSRGIIARYALYPDYHKVMGAMLKEFAQAVEKELDSEWEYRVYVDTGPLLEREVGAKGGIGFIGKNTTLINPSLGSYMLLGEIICNVSIKGSSRSTALSPRRGKAENVEGTCGSCTRCQIACPTNAFVEPYVLDARKCISYLTIENRGSVPDNLRPFMRNRIYGCDICQEVCPWNKKSDHLTMLQSTVDHAPHLLDLVGLDEDGFKYRYKGTPILRAKREGFIRNVLIAIGNWASEDAREYVTPLLKDESDIVREHASWALEQIDNCVNSK
ncbi:MAG: tRNA epoxyqueuosine(34) reductase QueG [Patescibacteria group bacterium]